MLKFSLRLKYSGMDPNLANNRILNPGNRKFDHFNAFVYINIKSKKGHKTSFSEAVILACAVVSDLPSYIENRNKS